MVNCNLQLVCGCLFTTLWSDSNAGNKRITFFFFISFSHFPFTLQSYLIWDEFMFTIRYHKSIMSERQIVVWPDSQRNHVFVQTFSSKRWTNNRSVKNNYQNWDNFTLVSMQPESLLSLHFQGSLVRISKLRVRSRGVWYNISTVGNSG